MQKFLAHEPLAAGLFNNEHCTASGTQTAWAGVLTNNIEVLRVVCQRLEQDYKALRPAMRKPYTAKDVEARICHEVSVCH